MGVDRTESMPLRRRVQTMQTEVASLNNRLAKLQVDVGGASDVGSGSGSPPQQPSVAAEEVADIPSEILPPPEEPAAFIGSAIKRKSRAVSLVAVNTGAGDL